MSHFYYQVLKSIQSQLSTFQVFYLQILQILFYGLSIQLLLEFHRIYTSYPSANTHFLRRQLLIILIARYLNVYIGHRIYILTPTIKQAFPKADRQLLISEIENSLQKSLEFTKWSCGILSTVLVLVTTMFFNVGLKILDRTVSDIELTKELKSMSLDVQKLLFLFAFIVMLIVGIVLAYYFVVQLFTFHKRLVLKVLRNCNYNSSYDLLNCSKWILFKELTKKALFWDYIKHFV